MRALARIGKLGTQMLKTRFDDEGGLALIATILMMALVAALVATAMSGAMSAMRASSSDYQDAKVFYAAEAGGEATLAQLSVALKDGYLAEDELANIRAPVIDAIDFDSFSVTKVGDTYVETITDGPYAGLYSLTQDVDVYSRAATIQGDMSAVIMRAKAQAIPIFQFGVFFEEDLEATNGPPMEFVGRVHSNGNIYLSSANAWYRDMVTTPNKLFHNRKDFNNILDGVYINDASANEVQLLFDSRTHPGAEAFKAQSCADFDCRVQSDAFGVDSLRMPLPEGVPMIEVIRPREDSDSDSEREVKFAWNADTYITVDLTDVRTKAEVCAGGGPKKDPDEIVGDLRMTALQPVVPGNKIRFKILDVPCDEVDDVDVVVKADGATIWSAELEETCGFSITLPTTVDMLEIVVSPDDDDAEVGPYINGTAFWYALQAINDLTPWPATTILRPAGKETPIAYDMCNVFWWQWSAFYDGREKELKDVFNIDIAQMTTWVGTNDARSMQVIYVDLVTPANFSNFPLDARNLMIDASLDPAVRMLNGTQLPNPMTVATEWPLYVEGDYNRFAKQPAALAGDGINILSNAWQDAQNLPAATAFTNCQGAVTEGNPCLDYENWVTTWAKRPSSETTVNGAFLAGHWPTPCDHVDPTCPADGSSAYYQDWYGGGLENFPRFLENWSGITLHYRGALISPFTSQMTTGTWNGTYYTPPVRDWHFDTDFQNPALLPPGTPNVGYVIRTAMREAY